MRTPLFHPPGPERPLSRRARLASIVAALVVAGLTALLLWLGAGPFGGRPDADPTNPLGSGPESVVPPALGATSGSSPSATARVDLDPRPRARAPDAEPSESPATPTAILTGRVLARRTGLPLAGALVSPLRGREAPEDVVLESTEGGRVAIRPEPRDEFAVTDAEGAFRLPLFGVATPTPLRLCAQHPDGVTGFTPLMAFLSEPATREGIEIRLDTGATIEGVVTPLHPGIVVGGRVGVDPEESDEDRVADVGADGRYRIAGVSPGAVEVIFRARSDAPAADGGLVPRAANVDVEDGETKRVDFTATPGVRVDVTVRRAGAPAENARVSILGDEAPRIYLTAVAEGPGIYAASGVPAGKAVITTYVAAHADTDVPIEVVAGRRNEFTVEIPTASVRGRVKVRGDGASPSRIEVALIRREAGSEDDRVDTEWTDAEGAYGFLDIPAGTYALAVEERDSTDGGDADDMKVASIEPIRREFDLRDGEALVEDFVAEPAGAVTVRVLDPAGRPLRRGGIVTLVPAGETRIPTSRWDRWFTFGGVTGPDGTVRIRGLERGRYVVHLDQSELDDTESAPFDVEPGVESLATIATRATDRVRVLFEILMPDGSVAFGQTLELKDAEGREIDTDIPHGPTKAYDFAIVAPGTYHLHVEGWAWETVERTIEVRSPSPMTVRVVLKAKAK